jgi:RND family efflux transporter MFP subunit
VCALIALTVSGFAVWQFLRYSRAVPAAATAGESSAAADSADGASGASAAAASDGGTAAQGEGTSVLDASGYIVAQREATVSAKTTGRLRDLYIEEGQQVTAGQIVARLDDSNTLAALAQASAQVAQAEAGLAAARTALADARPIFVRNQQEHNAAVISAQDFDTAKSAFDNAQSNVAVQSAAVAAARANLRVAQRFEDDTIVRAPFSGVITNKAAQPGDIVSPVSAGGGFTQTGICTIVDMNSLEADVDVSENFINRVHPGQRALVRLNAYPDWDIPASVIAIIPTADRSKATVKVRVGFKVRDPRILPAMGARVSFLSDKLTDKKE